MHHNYFNVCALWYSFFPHVMPIIKLEKQLPAYNKPRLEGFYPFTSTLSKKIQTTAADN